MLARRRFLSGLFAVPLTNLSFAQGTAGVARLKLNVRADNNNVRHMNPKRIGTHFPCDQKTPKAMSRKTDDKP